MISSSDSSDRSTSAKGAVAHPRTTHQHEDTRQDRDRSVDSAVWAALCVCLAVGVDEAVRS